MWVSARPPSRGQWYHGLIELEVKILKTLQWRSWGGYGFLIYSISLLRNFPYPFTIIIASDNETETCKQVEAPAVNGKPEDVSKEDARTGSSRFAFGFSSMRGQKVDRRRAAHYLRMQMKDLQFRLRELGTTGGSDSDESIFAEPLGVRHRKTIAVYEKSPIKPEKFPGKDFNRWQLWVRHYKSVAKANGWTDQQAIAALPACLTSWAVEEFETVPRKYIEKVPGEEAPIFETLLEILKPKLQQYRSPRATRSEFKSVTQNKTSP